MAQAQFLLHIAFSRRIIQRLHYPPLYPIRLYSAKDHPDDAVKMGKKTAFQQTPPQNESIQSQKEKDKEFNQQKEYANSRSSFGNRIPNLFAKDLPADNPFGPSLLPCFTLHKISDSENKDDSNSEKDKEILLTKYKLDVYTLDHCVAISKGLVNSHANNNSVIPLMLLNHPSLAAQRMLEHVVYNVTEALKADLLQVDVNRILKLGRALLRLQNLRTKNPNHSHNQNSNPSHQKDLLMILHNNTSEDLSLVPVENVAENPAILHNNRRHRSLLLTHQNQNNNNNNVYTGYSLARSQMRDLFLPGLQLMMRNLLQNDHNNSRGRDNIRRPITIIYVKDLASVLETSESRRLLQEFLLYSKTQGRFLLIGLDHSPSLLLPNSAQQQDALLQETTTPGTEATQLERDVHRYRILQSRLLASQRLHPPDEFTSNGGIGGNGSNQSNNQNNNNIPLNNNSSGGTNISWILPERPQDIIIDDNHGLITVPIMGPISGSPQRRQHDQALLQDQRQLTLEWNCLQLGLDDINTIQAAGIEVKKFLSQSMLHLDDITLLRVISSSSNDKNDMIEAVKLLTCKRNQDIPSGNQANAIITETLNKHEKRFLPCIVYPQQVSDVGMQDIGALDQVKQLLHDIITKPIQRPDLFSVGILKENTSGVLLFGPPGTGKTLLAKAIAADCQATFINVNLSTIFDMWVGEGEKNVRGLFSLARKFTPCIIFIDEVDALLQARSLPGPMGSRSGQLEVINEFMMEWDGLRGGHHNHGIVIMAATNRPYALDDAVLRRLPRRIMIDLPDQRAREQILRILLKDDQLAPDVNLMEIAERTDGHSGSDLKNIGKAAALQSRRRDQLIISQLDLLTALQMIAPSVDTDMASMHLLKKWNVKYGEVLLTTTSASSTDALQNRPKPNGGKLGF